MIDDTWIKNLKARGLAAPLSTALDLLEPLGPVGAQILWIAQPLSALVGASGWVGGLAEALEYPEGIAQLRQRLDEEDGGHGG
jgi:hypothetical protein